MVVDMDDMAKVTELMRPWKSSLSLLYLFK